MRVYDLLVVERELLHAVSAEFFRLYRISSVKELLRLTRRNYRPYLDLIVVHRGIDDPVLVDWLEEIVKLITACAEIRRSYFYDAAHTR